MKVERLQPYLEPLRKSVTVARPLAEAFALFTEGMGRWWPLHLHSVSQERARTCVLEPRAGGGVYEVRDDGQRFTWGTVLVWEPPHRLVLSWHPGRGPETAQEVEVTFRDAGGRTLVSLEHRGWQTLGPDAAEVRGSYDPGWDFVLGERFGGAAG